MAGELVAEAFLTAMFEKLSEKLASPELVNLFKGKKSVGDQLKELDLKLRLANRLLNDAEESQIRDPDVKKWLDELKDVIYRAQDLVEDIEDEARSKLERDQSGSGTSMLTKFKSIFPSLTQFDMTVQGEMATILQDLNLLLDDKVVRGFKVDDRKRTTSSQRLVAPIREDSHVHGRDADKQRVLELLLLDDIWGNKVGVLPIVGMGGLGKTTLAQQVYRDSSFKERGFQLRAWVTVSIEFDIFRIIKIILEKIKLQTCDIKEQADLQDELIEALKGKKFLFVLDDVWDEDYDNWDVLKSIFAFGQHESRIIVTTRSSEVAKIVACSGEIYELRQISSDDCWKIFVDHAFNGDLNADRQLQEIGKRIVKKCNGLPLAVKSVGGLLHHERSPKKWESILNSNVWEWCNKMQRNTILPSLWLSYHYLPSSCLKQCFAYCSVFPKGYKIKKDKIILLWMAEGFLQVDHHGQKRIEEVGEEYFNALVSRSLFQISSQSTLTFVMHDLVHDLAMFISREFCFSSTNNKNLKGLTSKTRHLSHFIFYEDHLKKGIFEAKHLRTFIELAYSSSKEFIEELLTARRPLRVLSLIRVKVTQNLPNSFNNIKNLRYLDLSNSEIEEVPGSVCTLYHLQTLLLSNCRHLAQLPTNMGRLISLRHLDTTNTPLKEMPPQMGNLKELQTLSDFVLGKSKGSSIKELEELQYLRGKLQVSRLQNVDSVEDIQKANLMRQKENLSELVFEWVGAIDTRREREVFVALEPHTSLKKLIVRGYGGFTFPNWVGDSSFSSIVSINLSDNELCQSLPPLGQLSSLQELVIKDFRGVETIDEEFYGKNSCITPFRSLETLTFCNMPKWRQWSLISGGEKKCACFPHLKMLSLDGCPNLLIRSIPGSDTIDNIKIKGCNKLEFPGNHRYASIIELEIARSCDSLKSLTLDYFPRLERLVLVKCENFESLTSSEENTSTALLHHSLKYWNIKDCKNLRSLPEEMRMLLPSLSSLGIFKCPEIESFPQGGLPSNLDCLMIVDCNKLVAQYKHWGLQGLTSLTTLCIGGYDMVLDSFPDHGFLPISLTRFYLWKFPQLRNLNGSKFEHLTSFEELELDNCNELQSLPEQVLPKLRRLCITNCPVLERRYHKGKGEVWHKISHIPDVDISGKTTREENRKDFEMERAENSASTNV